ncbi:protocadherin Fat 4-like [Dreissena polymorpha]|uniref:protocadherin Fat 4-like n=1 Tax=Dreissena polymorpha TaxID=45954 RepID=UPI002264BF06|nr:protocadherin Fat 4-like [Dreissena polymorpha]
MGQSGTGTDRQYSGAIKDYDPQGTFIVQVNATDKDITSPENQVEYALDVGNTANPYFTIDSRTGVITVNNRLSFDTSGRQQYTLFVTATDRGLNPNDVMVTTATVTIAVERNVAPIIQNKNTYFSSFSEGVDIDYNITQIFAIDANPATSMNGMLHYSILEPNASNKFQIDQSGVIRPRVTLKGLQPATWIFTVQVSDKGIPALSDTTKVEFSLNRISGPRFNPSESVYNKDENFRVGEVLARLQAEDPTPDGPLVYEIRGDGLSPTYFRLEMEGQTAVIKLNKSFTEDSNKSLFYKIRLQAYRRNDPNVFAEHIAMVYVNRNPSAPRFNHGDLVFNINETLPLKYVIGEVSANDTDIGSNGEILYSISQTELLPHYLQDYFSVNEFNGKILLIGDLTQDSRTFKYTMTVVAKDKGIPPRQDTVKVTINVSRNPNAPRWIGLPYSANVTENDLSGTPVIKVSAVDDDNDPIEYNIVRDTGAGSPYFSINQQTGQITVSNAPLYEDTVTSYNLRVTAHDKTSASRTAEATVEITVNRNIFPPVFVISSYKTKISEYISNGSPLDVLVRATDGDNVNSNSGILRYKFGTFNPPSAETLFEISSTTGVISIATPLIGNPLNAPTNVTMQVIAYDKTTAPRSATATVAVEIVRNTNAPIWITCPNSAATAERVTANTYITATSARDPDLNDDLNRDTPNAQVEYYLAGDTNSYARFFNVRDDGRLYTSQMLNFPALDTDFITIRVVAQDKSWQPKSVECALRINITKISATNRTIGFIQPIFHVDVSENEKRDTILKYLDVVNQNPNQVVDCQLDNSTYPAGLFTISRDNANKNCQLVLRGNLDFEDRREYRLTATVNEVRSKRQALNYGDVYNAWKTALIIVNVIDQNDESPKWVIPPYPRQTGLNSNTQDKYFGIVNKNTGSDTRVLTIMAIDRDAGNYGLVEYLRGLPDNDVPANPPFNLNSQSGEITSTASFNFRTDPVYRFQVMAKDNPGQTTTQNSINGEIVVYLVEDKHRFVAVMPGQPQDYANRIEPFRQAIQNKTSYICLIESVQHRTVKAGPDEVTTSTTGTDITFVLGDPDNKPNFPLLLHANQDFNRLFGPEWTIFVRTFANISVDDVHPPFTGNLQAQKVLSKSYVWWLDDPWAALIAITAISILLIIVGIIVLVFTHSRYMKYINNYRVYQQAYPGPEFVEPPSFLREYETQSLQMYVPPDEAVPTGGEVHMHLSAEGISAVDTSGTAAFNPVYIADEEPQFVQHTYTRDTTLL